MSDFKLRDIDTGHYQIGDVVANRGELDRERAMSERAAEKTAIEQLAEFPVREAEQLFASCHHCGWISRDVICRKCGRERNSGIRPLPPLVCKACEEGAHRDCQPNGCSCQTCHPPALSASSNTGAPKAVCTCRHDSGCSGPCDVCKSKDLAQLASDFWHPKAAGLREAEPLRALVEQFKALMTHEVGDYGIKRRMCFWCKSTDFYGPVSHRKDCKGVAFLSALSAALEGAATEKGGK